MDLPLDLDALDAARARIRDQIANTPLTLGERLSEQLGARVWLKHENLQGTGSFKLRGASHKLSKLMESPEPPTGVVAASAGNHAQAVALAARRVGLPATVVMPRTAPLTKVAACRALGAQLEQVGSTLEEAAGRARELARERDLAFVPPYDDWDVIAGQASCGLEIHDELPGAGTVVVPLGGGGLLSGIALALRSRGSRARIVGVQAEAVAPWRHFLDDGGFEEIPSEARTIADGIRVKAPGELTRQVIAAHVDAIVTVDEDAIARAILMLLEQTRTIGEGAGVVALAALLDGRIALDENNDVVCVISGGNIDMSVVGRSIDFGLSASGRLLSIAVTLPDRPGSLAKLVQTVAELEINVRDVRHRRGELHVPVGLTEITLELETRDREHQDELLAKLDSLGLRARLLNRSG